MLNDNTVIGFTESGTEIFYSDFLKNPYIIRDIKKLTPGGVKVLMLAREIDPFIDATDDTLMALKEDSVCH